MIKGAQQRCLLAWYVGRKKLSRAPPEVAVLMESAAQEFRSGQLCSAHTIHTPVSWHLGRKKFSAGVHSFTSPQSITEAEQPCHAHCLHSQRTWHVGMHSFTLPQSIMEAEQPCHAHFLHSQMTWHVGKNQPTWHVGKELLSKGALHATLAGIKNRAGHPGPASCIDGRMPCYVAQKKFSTLTESEALPENTENKARSTAAAAPESIPVEISAMQPCSATLTERENRAGRQVPASCSIDSQMSWYVGRKKFSTSTEVVALRESMEKTARSTGTASPECVVVENKAELPFPANSVDPSLSSCGFLKDNSLSSQYAWPPLSSQPSFITAKRSDFNDVVERVSRILSGRPWGQPVVDDLNKLNAYLNSYHVVAILKAQLSVSVALGFFAWLKQKDGYRHNVFTYSKLFEILGSAKEIHSIEPLMQDMLKDKVDMIPNIFTTVTRAYANAGMLKAAVSTFNGMEKYGCKPDSHAYGIIIDILVKAGCQQQAYGMYDKMLESGFFPNLYVCNLLVDSYWREERPDDAMALFKKMKEKGEVPNMNTYNFLIKALAKGGKAEALCSVIGEMDDKGVMPNLTTYNTLIGVLVQAGEIDTAVQFLDHMVGSGVKPNNFTYSYLISGLGKAGKLTEAQKLFKGLKELGGSPDDYVYNALVLNLSKAGKFNAAWQALQEMRSAGFKPRRSSYLALVDSFKEADKPDLVRQVFDAMQTDDCAPHIVAYHDLIEKYSADKNVDKACQVFQDMKKCSLPDVGTYNLMLKMYARVKDLRKCRQIFTDMRQAGIEPSVVSYSTMIQSLGQTGHVKDAYNLFKEMRKKGCKPDAVAYGTILKAMVNAGQVQKAVAVFEEGKKAYKDLVMYSIMIDGFGKARKFDKALALLKEMKSKGIQPDVVIFNSLIASLFKGDEREEAYDLYRNMPKYGCEPNKRTKDIVNSLTKKAMTRKRK
eukprot:c21605_g1_i1 orf=830-3646(-)